MQLTHSSAIAWLLVTATLSCAAAVGGAQASISDDDVRAILAARVDALTAGAGGVGIVVGRLNAGGRRVLSAGHLDIGKRRPVDGDTLFEIGSVTKAFTALLLADMTTRGELRLEDRVLSHLAPGTKVPERNGRAITLLDLATHTAGLPFMPDGNQPAMDESAAAARRRLYRFISDYKVTSAIGDTWDYSNLGYWLLSEALAAKGAASFDRLLQVRILEPLRLRSTTLKPSLEMKRRLAAGHDAAMNPTRSFSEVPVYRDMPAAGGLLSTADDLLTFLAVATGQLDSPLRPAIRATLATRRPTGRKGEMQALGWVIEGDEKSTLIVHDGGTWGYASSMMWDPSTGEGVVVLSNHVGRVDDIARHILRPDSPLQPPPPRPKEITLPAATLARYAGRYEADGEGVFVVRRGAIGITIQLPDDWGLPTLQLRAESRTDFFVAELPMRVTFELNNGGLPDAAVIHPPRGQNPVRALRRPR